MMLALRFGNWFKALAPLAAGGTALSLAVGMGACGPTAAAPAPTPIEDGGGAADTSAASPELPCAVHAIVRNQCQSCHSATPAFGAPQSLVSYADLTRVLSPGTRQIDAMLARINNNDKPMPQAPNPRMPAADRAVLAAWAAAPAPRGASEKCADTPLPKPEGLTCTPDLFIKPASAYTMPTDKPDQYVCYGIDFDSANKRHITAIAPQIGNNKIVHHVLLFEADQAVAPTPTECSSGGLSMSWRMIYGWAPGAKALELPPEAGFPLQGKKHYAVQLHYNNIKALSGETDSTGFGLCSTDVLRPNDADVMAFGTHAIDIPARANNYVRDCSLSARAVTKDLHFFAAMPHMHQLGTSISTTLISGGKETDMGTVANWNFDTQFWQPLDVTVKPGDVIRTRCSYANPSANNVKFGEKTADEMCYSFSMYYPRIPSPWSWALPAQSSTCL